MPKVFLPFWAPDIVSRLQMHMSLYRLNFLFCPSPIVVFDLALLYHRELNMSSVYSIVYARRKWCRFRDTRRSYTCTWFVFVRIHLLLASYYVSKTLVERESARVCVFAKYPHAMHIKLYMQRQFIIYWTQPIYSKVSIMSICKFGRRCIALMPSHRFKYYSPVCICETLV